MYVFESPIDLMSHASLEIAAIGNAEAWNRHNRLSLSGTSDRAIPYFLDRHKDIDNIIFCLDNDPAGHEAAVALAKKYAKKGFKTRIEFPIGKDFNDDLMAHLDGC